MNSFQEDLADLLKARFPFIYIPTWEEERILSVIEDVVQDESLIRTPRDLFTWSATEGIIGPDGAEKHTMTPLKALEFFGSYENAALLVLKDFHYFFGGMGGRPDYLVIRKLRDLAGLLKSSIRPQNIIFIAPSRVLPDELQKDITILDFHLPTFEDARKLLRDMMAANRNSDRITIDLRPEEEEQLAKAALGLTLKEMENAFARAIVQDGRLDIQDVDVILEEKRQVVKKMEILEFIQPDSTMDEVGGSENLKRWLAKRNQSWMESAQRYGLPSPKGVLVTGVPGCGKSLIAKAISSMWHLPLLRLDIGKIFSGVVGSSEENMRQAIHMAEAISPSILWIDEIEKGFGSLGGSGDSGTSTRVFGTFLTWMQEKKKPVFVVATANQIQDLPPELLRKGRFDEIFFVDLPTKRERKEIFRVHLGKRIQDPEVAGELEINDSLSEALADQTEGFVGAEIEQVVIAALFEAYSESRGLQFADFEKSIRQMVPLSVTQSEQIRRIRDWANVRAVAATAQEDLQGYRDVQGDRIPETDDVGFNRGGRTIDI